MKLPELKIGNLKAMLPIIQGGMGIGISLCGLASAVANQGGIGVISGVQVGFREHDFLQNPIEANLRAINSEIKKARSMTTGIIGMNLMTAMNNYELYVREAVSAGIDLIISGAGLPLTLPKLVKDTNTKIVPIVSSVKAASIIIRSFLKNDRLPDAIVVEGPLAGGHLGFKMDDLKDNKCKTLKDITIEVKDLAMQYESSHNVNIPVISAGGIRTNQDIRDLIDAGADGVQISSLFVPTEECDAHINFKYAYINASDGDEVVIKSPVGMPARGIKNEFLKNIIDGNREDINRCYNCMSSCNINNIPFCISQSLIDSAQGRNGLVFSGANIGSINKLSTVKEVIEKLIL